MLATDYLASYSSTSTDQNGDAAYKAKAETTDKQNAADGKT